MKKAEFIKELEMMLELLPGELKQEANLNDYETWDSLSQLSLISLVDKKLGYVIELYEIENLKTVNDILELLKEHLEDDS